MAAALVTACAAGEPDPELDGAEQSTDLSSADRLARCDSDPRVIAGLVRRELCAGADLFFRATFAGNGRTCGTCHPADNNFTLDVEFIDALPDLDPLFVFERSAPLAELEAEELRTLALIRENVDGFEDLDGKFTLRAVTHTLSLTTSRAPDPADGTATPPLERMGWSGDGAPGGGTLRDFAVGAVIQHFPKDLGRQENVSFRLPTDEELDLLLDFQLGLGRTNELDLAQIALGDPAADDGRLAYLDPARGRCNLCHRNGGANDQASGLNRNSDTGTRKAPAADSIGVFDGGFGGQGLTEFNIDATGAGFLNAFGDGTFNPPPVIEAVDSAPFFHTNAFGPDIESAIAFYNLDIFAESPSGQELQGVFGGPVAMSPTDIANIGRFLRVLNAAFNLDIALQRLEGARTLVDRFHNHRVDVQKRLLQLAGVEIDDALDVLAGASGGALHGGAQVSLDSSKDEIAAGRSTGSWRVRRARIAAAIEHVRTARDEFGSNITYQLGAGNLMH